MARTCGEYQQPEPDHRQHRQARRHQPVDHRPVQRHGHARVVILLGLPGYRLLEKAQDRKHVAEFWGIDESFFPPARGLTQTDIFPAIETGEIKGLWLVATNPMTSMANQPRIRKAMENFNSWWCRTSTKTWRPTSTPTSSCRPPCGPRREGCHTNTERRVNLTRNVLEPTRQQGRLLDLQRACPNASRIATPFISRPRRKARSRR